jgi:hypothetical protein
LYLSLSVEYTITKALSKVIINFKNGTIPT